MFTQMRILENVRSKPSAAEQLPFKLLNLFSFSRRSFVVATDVPSCFCDGFLLMNQCLSFLYQGLREYEESIVPVFFRRPCSRANWKTARKGLMTKNQKAKTSKPALLHAKCSVEPRIHAAFSHPPANKRRLKTFVH